MKRSERIFYDLTESTEYVEMLDTRFYFSSSFNKERFLRGYYSFIKEEEDKISSKYGIKLRIKFYLLISYYLKIEKRGFYILRLSKKTGEYSLNYQKDDIIFTEFYDSEV